MPNSVSNAHVDPLSRINLGIVCPMANEEQTVTSFVNAVLDRCGTYGFKSITFFGVLDRKTRDRTRELLEQLSQRRSELRVVWAPENQCVVDAYVAGYEAALEAECDWILEIDAGFSHEPSDIDHFFIKLGDGYDCIFGSRFCDGGSMAERSTTRYVISRGGTILSNLMLGTKLKDMTSGFELFSRGALKYVLNRGIHSRGPFFQTEIKAYCRNLKSVEVPINYRAPSHNISAPALADSFKNLWRLFKLRVKGELSARTDVR